MTKTAVEKIDRYPLPITSSRGYNPATIRSPIKRLSTLKSPCNRRRSFLRVILPFICTFLVLGGILFAVLYSLLNKSNSASTDVSTTTDTTTTTESTTTSVTTTTSQTTSTETTVTTTTTTTTTTTPKLCVTDLTLLTNITETTYPIWNTVAGGDSSVATLGTSSGNYYTGEIHSYAFDQDPTTKYTNFGSCSSTVYGFACGTKTGVYLTLNRGASLLLAFQFTAANDNVYRDPFNVTIEGSNQTSSALTLGSSWSLIYEGSSGLETDPGRRNPGKFRYIPENMIWYNSYRILITAKRYNQTSTQYAEISLYGY